MMCASDHLNLEPTLEPTDIRKISVSTSVYCSQGLVAHGAQRRIYLCSPW